MCIRDRPTHHHRARPTASAPRRSGPATRSGPDGHGSGIRGRGRPCPRPTADRRPRPGEAPGRPGRTDPARPRVRCSGASHIVRHPGPRHPPRVVTQVEANGATCDVLVVGAGIVGLATARAFLRRRPGFRLIVVDKERTVSSHQTGHNSGVLHAGLYYQPGSLKARLCRTGKQAMEQFAEEHGLEVRRCGKLVIAADRDELPALRDLHQRAVANRVPGLEPLGPAGIADVEPHAVGAGALWSPSTGVIDYRAVAVAMAEDVRAAGGELLLGTEVTAMVARSGRITVHTGGGTVVARHVVTCGGLHADRLAAMTGVAPDERIVPFRGDDYTLTESAAHLVKGLIYPDPDPRFPFLGIHLTRTVDGRVLAGPNAVLALHREGYRRRDVRREAVRSVVTSPGFHPLARRYWRTGLAEMWRDVDKD